MSSLGEVERDLIYSDDDEDFSSAEDGGSDSEPTMLDELHQGQHRGGSGVAQQSSGAAAASGSGSGGSRHRFRKSPRPSGSGGEAERGRSSKGGLAASASAAAAARQRNLKQKFVALLKKFKVTDPEDPEHDQSLSLDQKLSGEWQLSVGRLRILHVQLFLQNVCAFAPFLRPTYGLFSPYIAPFLSSKKAPSKVLCQLCFCLSFCVVL